MNVENIVVAYVVTTAIGLLISYFIIRAAVKHGASAALREREERLDRRVKQAIEAEQLEVRRVERRASN